MIHQSLSFSGTLFISNNMPFYGESLEMIATFQRIARKQKYHLQRKYYNLILGLVQQFVSFLKCDTLVRQNYYFRTKLLHKPNFY